MQKSTRSFILLLHALVWAAAIIAGSVFFSDKVWGETLFIWLIVGFTITNGLLSHALGGSDRRC